MSVTTQQINIEARDGYVLSATLFEPAASGKGVVQIQGGVGIPQTTYAPLASFLVENGYTVLTFDYRGIGGSAPAQLKGFDATIVDWGKLDMTGVFDWVIKKYPDADKTILGHSIGGQVVGLMDNCDQIDQLIFVACSTGYWRDMSAPDRWAVPLAWYGYVPLAVSLLGYANAKAIGWGENLPKGVVMQWRKWCINTNYFEVDFDTVFAPVYFNQVKAPLHCLYLSDDPVANDVTVRQLMQHYDHAEVTLEKIDPGAAGLKKIGHSGYFLEQSGKSLWPRLLVILR